MKPIFNSFCEFIDEKIFSEENVGTFVPFVVDKTLIDEFCRKYGINERGLMLSVRSKLYSYSRAISNIKGILAIQLYAASKRANSDGVTVKNYRDRLSQVLDWDMNDLQRWMEENQDYYWETFYNWCDSHFFFVPKCKRKSGAGRYVQYPLMQSNSVFTEEDLKYIARAFVESNLMPDEDISEEDFWRNISKYSIVNYFRTSHSRVVRDNSRTDKDYLKQIFNYYLRWNGEYKAGFNSQSKTQRRFDKDEYLYLNEDLSQLQIHNSKLTLLKSYDVAKLKYREVTSFFVFKHQGLILFKKDDVYDGYWQETRYLEKGRDGIAIVFNGQYSRQIQQAESLIRMYAHVSIYKVTESASTLNFYTKKRFFSLESGLKVGRRIYLYGGGPQLRISQKSKFWVDGKPFECTSFEECLDLSNLNIGKHTVRFPNFKTIEFEITEQEVSSPKWMSKYNKWNITKENHQWDSYRLEKGIVGLDFTIIPQSFLENPQGSVLRRWSRMHLLGETQPKENNITLKILSNINH